MTWVPWLRQSSRACCCYILHRVGFGERRALAGDKRIDRKACHTAHNGTSRAMGTHLFPWIERGKFEVQTNKCRVLSHRTRTNRH